ncbi:MAG: DUF4412 domain-containing protein [Bacteroidota bacterium]
MKLLKAILLLVIFSLSFSQNSNAQILKKLKKRVQQAVEETVIDKTADKAAQETGKAMDSLLEIDPDYQPNNKNILYGNNEDIPIESVYKFDTSVTYKMESVTDNKPVSMDYNMLFSKNNNYLATKMQNINSEDFKGKEGTMQMTTILDDKNQAMIMLMEEQKIAQVISMEKIKDVAVNEENETSQMDINKPNIKKTGKSKKILGYNCDEFETITDDGKATFWITKELSIYHKNMFSNLNRSLGGDQFNNFPDAAKGLMMEMFFEGKNGEKNTMKVIDINKKSSEISTTGYQFMNLSKFMKN